MIPTTIYQEDVVEATNKTIQGTGSFYIRVGTSDDDSLTETIRRNTYQKKGITIEPGEVWIDLGANIGGFAILAAMRGATVIAYEAEENCFAMLERNVLLNNLLDQIEIRHAAIVHDARSEDHVVIHRGFTPKQQRRSGISKKFRAMESQNVRADRFSEIVAGRCVKMNVEGEEIGILTYAEKFTSPKFVFEWSFDVDNKISTLRAAIDKLDQFYHRVELSKKIDWSMEIWPGNFYPPNLFVYCSGLK